MRKLLSVGRGPFTDGRAEEVKGAELALITLKGVVTVLKERIGKARKLNSKSLLSDVQKKFEEVEGAFASVCGSKRRLEILVYGPIS